MSKSSAQAERRQTRPGTFQPGNRASSKERSPRGRWITRQLISQLSEEMDDPDWDPKDKTKVRKRAKVIYFFCRKLIQLALDGDTTAIKLVMDRIEGTAIQTLQYRDIPEGEETPEQLAAIQETRAKISEMSPDERIRLYRASLSEATRTAGSA